MTLKEAIEKRIRSPLTQNDVGKLIGATQSTVSSIENGTGRASSKLVKKYLKVMQSLATKPPEQLPLSFISASGATKPAEQQDEVSKMLKQMEAMRDQFYAAMDKAQAAAHQPAPTPPAPSTPLAIQNAYNAGAEAMREKLLETFEGFVRSLRAPGETIPPGNWSAVSMEVK